MIEHFILPEEGPLLRSARRSNGDTHQQEDRYHPSEISGRVPRLVNVTSRTAVSYALHLGANQILLESSGNDHGVREIIEDYRSGATTDQEPLQLRLSAFALSLIVTRRCSASKLSTGSSRRAKTSNRSWRMYAKSSMSIARSDALVMRSLGSWMFIAGLIGRMFTVGWFFQKYGSCTSQVQWHQKADHLQRA